MSEKVEITRLLNKWKDGEESALEKLVPLVETQLRHLAKAFLRREKSGHLLQTTALINELYIKLFEQKNVEWQNRSHFFAISATCMRRIIIDYARSINREKRGGKFEHLPISEINLISPEKSGELIALDEALKKLEKQDKRQSQIVEMRTFGGYSVEEIAQILGISERTIQREWQMAKAWLRTEVSK